MKKSLIFILTLIFSLPLWSSVNDVPTGHLKVVPGQIYGFKSHPTELANIKKSFAVIEAVINSEEFKAKVINYVGLDGKRAYSSNKGLTNEQIYSKLMEGNELLGGEQTLGEMNFDIERYNKWWSKVIGYTSPGVDNWIEVNGKFYANYQADSIAGNLTHEWIHLNGFYHDSARDHDSVPYAVGYIMENLATKFLKQGFLE